MKKTQVALAALALVASTAAMADGVSIYGNLEAGVARTSGAGTYMSTAGGFTAGTYIGFKGTEEVGNGLKAAFNLEAGVDLNGYSNNGGGATACQSGDATKCNGSLFSRTATVSLAGDFGTVAAGRQISPMVSAYAGTGTLGNGHFFVNYIAQAGGAAVNSATTTNNYYEGFFVPNAVSYTSPSLNGFTVSALTQIASGNQRGTIPAEISSDSYQAYSVNGAVGMVNVAAAYDDRNGIDSTSMFAANTKLGEIALTGSYHSYKAKDKKSVGSYSVEAGYNLTEAAMVGIQYGHIGTDTSKSLTGVFGKYALSKRTQVYATYITASNAPSSYDLRGETFSGGGSRPGSNNTAAVGVAHSF